MTQLLILGLVHLVTSKLRMAMALETSIVGAREASPTSCALEGAMSGPKGRAGVLSA